MKIRSLSLIFLCLSFVLSSCNTSLSDLKRSSGNKLFDTSGYQSNKRMPLYNKKYINKAKKNIINSEYDEDEENLENDEMINPSQKNIAMYKQMVGSKSNKNTRRNFNQKRAAYLADMIDDEEDSGDLISSRNRLSQRDSSKNKSDLEQEISEIKIMLQKTKDEIAKSKCPYSKEEGKTKTAKPLSKNQRAGSYEDDREFDEELRNASDKYIPPKPGSMTSVIQH